jgi:hypothetical protein
MTMKTKQTVSPAALGAAARGDLANLMVAFTPGGIERQEREEQVRATATFDRLPKDGPWEQIKALGFKVLGDLDDIFYRVEAPAGWTIRPSDHSMWSYVHDANGHRRMGVFYKGAFYDRSAHVGLEPRYSVLRTYEGDRYVYVNDAIKPGVERADWSRGPLEPRPERIDNEEQRQAYREAMDREDALVALAEVWLTENRPEWRSPLAYW